MFGIGIVELVVILMLLVLYPLPTYIALAKRHPRRVAIILVNLIGGLFGGVGWIIALVLCFLRIKSKEEAALPIALQHWYRLKELGEISEEEYQAKVEENKAHPISMGGYYGSGG